MPTSTPLRRIAAPGPSLSVILLFDGTRPELEQALACVGEHCRSLEAELIVVSAGPVSDHDALRATHGDFLFLQAPAGSSNDTLRVLGMEHATGDIVSLRLHSAVGDGGWLRAFGPSSDVRPALESARPLVPIPGDLAPAADQRSDAADVPRPAGQRLRHRDLVRPPDPASPSPLGAHAQGRGASPTGR